MNKSNVDIAIWLSKYVRESWKYVGDKIHVKGNITISDREMEELPVQFAEVTGTFRIKNASYLKSVKGFPEHAGSIVLENCMFPQSYYLIAHDEHKTLRESLRDNFETVLADEFVLEAAKKAFPSLIEEKRGKIASKNFGF